MQNNSIIANYGYDSPPQAEETNELGELDLGEINPKEEYKINTLPIKQS